MILVDFSLICHISAWSKSDSDVYLMEQGSRNGNSVLDSEELKTSILLKLGQINHRFRNEYGEMVICCDGSNSWRLQTFKHYKAARKEKRRIASKEEQEQSKLFFEVVHETIEDLKEYFPYSVIHLEEIEGDDAIAVLAMEKPGKHLIVSSDRDFYQLHRYENVHQWNPREHSFVNVENPDDVLLEHIIRGDTSDGIPNIKMPVDFFVNKKGLKRQKSITEKFLKNSEENIKEHLDRFSENRTLIDFRYIPTWISTEILRVHDENDASDRVYKYITKVHRDKRLFENINSFTVE